MADFALNFMQLMEIDVTPQAATRDYRRLAAGLNSATPANNESLSQDNYLDGGGYGSTDAIGAQYIITCAGHRDTDDAAQNYIFGTQLSLGEDRKTTCRRYDAAGNMKSGSVTICNIEESGGDAGSKSEIGFELHFNGKPSETAATVAPAANQKIDAGSVVGTTRFSVKLATATNQAKYKLRGQTAGAINASQYVAGLLDYNEGVLQAMSSVCTTGAETTSGNITAVITAACLSGGTDSVTIAVDEDDTPTQVAEKVRVALAAETGTGAVGDMFYITRDTATITLTAKSAAANDVLYNFAVTDTSLTGVVFAAISAPVAGAVNADITASAGQYLQMFEVDANDRVVSFSEKALVSGDIKSA